MTLPSGFRITKRLENTTFSSFFLLYFDVILTILYINAIMQTTKVVWSKKMKKVYLKELIFDILCAITAGIIVGSAYYFFQNSILAVLIKKIN